MSGETISISMKPPCKTLGMTKLFLDAIFPRVPPKTSVSDTVLGHIFSQQCKPKQLKRYKAFIDNCLKCSEKKYDRWNHEADI